MEIIESLEEIGLSRQEAQVYLNTIKLGDAKASEIAQKTNLQRGAIYYILKLLKEKGFVSEVTRSGIKYYSAASPNRIFQLIEDERRKKLTLLKEISKELKKLSATSLEKPRIEIYEGEEGFKTIFEKLLEKKNQEWRCYLSSEILEYNPIFHIQFRKRRKNNNISIRTITEKNQKMEEIKKLDKEELRHTRYNNKILSNSKTLSYILDDAIIFIKANKKEQLAVYIKEKEFADLHKRIFDKIWQESGD